LRSRDWAAAEYKGRDTVAVGSVRFVLVVLVVGLLNWPDGARAEPDGPPIAGTFHIDVPLRPTVRDMLARSATFRRQWNVVTGRRGVHLTVFLTDGVLVPACRARTTIKKYSSGLLLAVVVIPPKGDYPELLAHELEHVIEQIEGVDLAALARSGSTGVRERPDGAFETARAQNVGLVVAMELKMATRAD
jgi:hypothetical protein